MMVLAACEYGLDGDFTRLVNPTGRFVLGGSYADCGVTGRKLACDTYGGIGRMGGGALSGKDPTKVDRSAAYMARKIAKDIVQAGYADKCEVQLAYAIGVVQPVGVSVECFGTEHQPLDFIEAYVHDSYDLTPQGIIQRLGLLDVDYNKVSAYGVIQHFIYSQNHSIHVKFNKAPASNKVTYIPSDSLIPEPFMLPLSRTNEKRQASTVQSRPVFPQTAPGVKLPCALTSI